MIQTGDFVRVKGSGTHDGWVSTMDNMVGHVYRVTVVDADPVDYVIDRLIFREDEIELVNMNYQAIFKTDMGYLPLYVIDEEFTLTAEEMATLGNAKRGDRFHFDYDLGGDFECVGTVEEMLKEIEYFKESKRLMVDKVKARNKIISNLEEKLERLAGFLRPLMSVIPFKGIELTSDGEDIVDSATGEILSE